MLRLRFGVEDLVRTRFALPSVFCDLAGSVQAFQQPGSSIRRRWQATRRGATWQAGPLLELVPRTGSLPGFLIPEVDDGHLDALLDVVQATPLTQIRAELAEAHPESAGSPRMRELWFGRRHALNDLGSAIRCYHEQVLSPRLPALQDLESAELSRRAWQLATRGIEDVLSTLHQQIRWRDGVLEVDLPVTANVDLGGRGLRLCPSATWTRPGFAFHWQGQPGLVYPLPLTDVRMHDNPNDREGNLAALVGATRARVLRALTSEHTTSSLAAAADVSVSSASMHAAALRASGLVVTRRDGRTVRHTLTALGRQLVAASAVID